MTVGTIYARTGIGKGTLFSEYARLSERRISEVRSGVRESVARLSRTSGKGAGEQGVPEVRAEIRRPASRGVGAFGLSGFRAFEHLFAQMLTSPDAQML